jgi:nucleotide-binding universal stress UspA family protein
MTSVRRILVPVDFTEGSTAALRHASDLTTMFGSQLHVLHVIAKREPPPWAAALCGQTRTATSDSDRMSALDRLATLIVTTRLDPFSTTGVVRVGCPDDVIAGYADEINAGLIVMGVHGDRLATPGSVGAVIAAVLSAVSCPVMAIPSTPADVAAASLALRRGIVC